MCQYYNVSPSEVLPRSLLLRYMIFLYGDGIEIIFTLNYFSILSPFVFLSICSTFSLFDKIWTETTVNTLYNLCTLESTKHKYTHFFFPLHPLTGQLNIMEKIVILRSSHRSETLRHDPNEVYKQGRLSLKTPISLWEYGTCTQWFGIYLVQGLHPHSVDNLLYK